MKKTIAIIAMLGYACPFVYGAMFQDFSSWSMAGYMFMLVVTPVLAVVCSKAWGLKAVFLGNLITFFVSYYLIVGVEDVERWEYYFKPLTPVQMLVFVSVGIGLLQLVVVKIMKKKESRHE